MKGMNLETEMQGTLALFCWGDVLRKAQVADRKENV